MVGPGKVHISRVKRARKVKHVIENTWKKVRARGIKRPGTARPRHKPLKSLDKGFLYRFAKWKSGHVQLSVCPDRARAPELRENIMQIIVDIHRFAL